MTTSTPIKRRPGAPRKDNVVLQVCVSRRVRERLDKIIHDRGGSLSGYAEQAIIAHLEKLEKPE